MVSDAHASAHRQGLWFRRLLLHCSDSDGHRFQELKKFICIFSTQQKCNKNLALQWTSICADTVYEMRATSQSAATVVSTVKKRAEALHGWRSRGILLQSSLVCGHSIPGLLRDHCTQIRGHVCIPDASSIQSLHSVAKQSTAGNQRCLSIWGYCAPDQDRGIQTVEENMVQLKHWNTIQQRKEAKM